MAGRRLTQQQKLRIKRIQEERRARLAKRSVSALDEDNLSPPMEGLVIVRHGASLVVEDTQGKIRRCLTRQNIGHPVCGDHVVWQAADDEAGIVTALLPRESVLSRPDFSGQDKPLAANITQLVVVLAPYPEPTGYLLDQYLVSAEAMGVRALIALNKIDLLDGEAAQAFLRQFQHYAEIGYPLVAVSAKRERGLDELVEKLRDQTSILVGQSGVGKSSLINALLPSLELQTGRLSEATGLGRHTTSAATCYHLPNGGDLIDSPGVRSFRISQLTRAQLEGYYPDFHPYLGQCRFHNCTHEHEPECAIRQAVAAGDIDPKRLESFLSLGKVLEQSQSL